MKKALLIALLVVVGGISALITYKLFDWARAPRASTIAAAIEEGFRMAEAKIRPTLPKKIDDVTTLTDVTHSGVVLTYHYRVDSDNFTVLPNFIQLVQKSATEMACKTEDMKKAMNLGGIFQYTYSDAHAKSLGTFDIKALDCG